MDEKERQVIKRVRSEFREAAESHSENTALARLYRERGEAL